MIIDTPDPTTNQIVHLLADGVTSVGRYLTTSVSSKLVTSTEAKALALAGIRLFVVFEVYGGADGVDDINAGYGAIDGDFARKYMPKIGAPNDGTVCIYFAIDRDFSTMEIAGMALPYFQAITRELMGSGYLVGVYGSGAVCGAVCRAGFASYAWLSGSTGWTDSKTYLAAKPPELRLVQQRMDTKIANLDADTDVALRPFGDFTPVFAAAA